MKPTPAQLKGLYQYWFTASNGALIECFMEYSPAERETRWNPGCTESIDLRYALVGGTDIAELLPKNIIDDIEGEALVHMAECAQDAKADAAEAKWRDMLEEVA